MHFKRTQIVHKCGQSIQLVHKVKHVRICVFYGYTRGHLHVLWHMYTNTQVVLWHMYTRYTCVLGYTRVENDT